MVLPAPVAGELLGGAARSHFSLGKIEDPSPLTELGHFQQRSAAGLLHIVTMGGNGQDVQGKRRHVSRELLLSLHQESRQGFQRIRARTEVVHLRKSCFHEHVSFLH